VAIAGNRDGVLALGVRSPTPGTWFIREELALSGDRAIVR